MIGPKTRWQVTKETDMRKSRFTEEQIIKVLKEHHAGLSAGELCRKSRHQRRDVLQLALTLWRDGGFRTPAS